MPISAFILFFVMHVFCSVSHCYKKQFKQLIFVSSIYFSANSKSTAGAICH